MDLNFVTHRTEQNTNSSRRPICESVKSLIEIDMSPEGPQMNHNENHCIHTVDQVQCVFIINR